MVTKFVAPPFGGHGSGICLLKKNRKILNELNKQYKEERKSKS